MDKINIFWFRRDLRSHDNRGFFKALTSEFPVLPIFIFDKNILDELDDPADARVFFIHKQIEKLHHTFKDHGSGLKVIHDQPLNAFKAILNDHQVQHVFTNEDYEPYGRERDTLIHDFLEKKGVGFTRVKDHVIFSPEEIFTEQNQPYKVFTPYKNKWRERLQPSDYESVNTREHMDNLYKTSIERPVSLEALDFKPSSVEIPEVAFDEQIISQYQQKRNFPAIRSTTRLSIHL